MDGIILTPLRQIYNLKGDVYHVLKKSDNSFDGFGEVYFSTIHKDKTKGWKKHTKMTLNLVVPVGRIKFVIYNEDTRKFSSVTLSQDNYQRLTVKPNFWLAFKGLEKSNILLNLASIEHDPAEAVNIELEEVKYDW